MKTLLFPLILTFSAFSHAECENIICRTRQSINASFQHQPIPAPVKEEKRGVRVYFMRENQEVSFPQNRDIMLGMIFVPISANRDLKLISATKRYTTGEQSIFGKAGIDGLFYGDILINITPDLLRVYGFQDFDTLTLRKGDYVIIKNFIGGSMRGKINFNNGYSDYSLGVRSGVKLEIKNINYKVGLDSEVTLMDRHVGQHQSPFISFEVRY